LIKHKIIGFDTGLKIAKRDNLQEVEMFDTLRYSKILEAVGVSRDQAEAHIRIIAEIVEGDLATKQDLKELEYRLIVKLGAVITAIVAVALTIVKIFLDYP
jgi:hypothetical protein